jgi:hypothetical protein
MTTKTGSATIAAIMMETIVHLSKPRRGGGIAEPAPASVPAPTPSAIAPHSCGYGRRHVS